MPQGATPSPTQSLVDALMFDLAWAPSNAAHAGGRVPTAQPVAPVPSWRHIVQRKAKKEQNARDQRARVVARLAASPMRRQVGFAAPQPGGAPTGAVLQDSTGTGPTRR